MDTLHIRFLRFSAFYSPLLLAIENARTGDVWTWFHAHPFVQAGTARLHLKPAR